MQSPGTWPMNHGNTDAAVHTQPTETLLMMTWWQVDVGHATSQLLAQLGWQGLKSLQQKVYYTYSSIVTCSVCLLLMSIYCLFAA